MNTDGLHLARQRIADCVQLDGSGVLIQRKEGLNLAGLGLTDEDLEGRFNPGERQLPEIGLQNLKRLRYLDLSGNRLTRLPVGVTSMAELRWLGLNFNALESLPDGLGVLSGLQRLYVRGNRLRHLPESIGLLPRLLELDLHGNALEALPSTFIKLLEREGTPGDSAVHLELGGNPLQAEAAAGAGRETLLAYLRALQQESGKPQGKLLLVGEGRVGKSSLLRALLGLPHDAALSTTHGLKIERWELAGAGGHGNPVQLNCWDFSGQQEMRETHQMFFTAPALYLLVWDPNRGQSESERQLFEWLWLIHQCQREGARARVLVVATFHRSRDRHEPDNKFDLLRDFGPDGAGILHGFVSVDSDDDSAGGGRYGISEVSKWVRNQIVEDATFTQSVPARWEEAVGECLGGRTPILRWEEFVGICRSHGRELPVEALGRTMNALGRLVWFEDESVLRDYVVLQPAWLGKAISYVFEKASSVPEVETRETPLGAGLVPTSAMDKIWTAPGTRDESGNPEPGYPAYLFPIFRRLMRKFDMIQPLGPAVATAARDGQGGEPQWYLVPARLAGKPETWDRDWSSRGTIALRLALKSRGWKPEASEADLNPWIAQGIFWRLIVRLHPQAQGRQSLANAAHWRRGLRLRDRSWGDARVHLERHCIYFEGSTHLSGWVLSALDQLLADVNQRFKTQVHYDEELACQPVSSEEAGTQIECAQGLDCRRYFSPERLRRWLEPGPQGRQVTVLECGQGTCDFQIDVRRTLGGLHFGRATEDKVLSELKILREGVDEIRDGMRTLLSSARNLDGLLVQVVESLHQSGGRLDGVVEAAIKKYLPELKTVMFEVLRANDEDTSRRGPSLFSFQPAESYSFWTDIGPRLAKKVILHVHCEHSLLPVSWLKNGVDSPGRFEIESSVEWVRRLGPFFLGLGRLLGAGSVLSVAFGGSDSIAQPVLEAFKTVPAELFSKGPVLPPDMNPGGDTWDPRKPWCADPRWLADMHEIIREKLGLDPAAELHEHSRRIGLVRVWDRNNSRFLWVHPQFESLYAEC